MAPSFKVRLFLAGVLSGAGVLSAAQSDISTIAIPIHTTLAPVLPLVEAQVPKSIDDTRSQTGFKFSYKVIRDPIAISMSGSTLLASTVAHYSVEACPKLFGCISCGVGEALREANLALSAQFAWDADWRLRSTTTAQPVTFASRCEVTSLGFDITDRVIGPVVDDQLRKVARAIDDNTPAVTSFRTNATDVWTTLQIPYEIAPKTWLVFEPIDAGLSPLVGQKLDVTSTLSLTARTYVTVGERPVVSPAPLPPLQSRVANPGFTIPFEVRVPYAEATAMANEYAQKSGGVPVDHIVISQAGGGKFGVDANVVYKDYNGPVHLEGTSATDLDFALDPAHKSLSMTIIDAVGHDIIRSRLRSAAAASLAQHSATARDEITRALTRDLGHGAQLSGHADVVRADKVIANSDGIVVHVTVSGTATLTVIPSVSEGPGRSVKR